MRFVLGEERAELVNADAQAYLHDTVPFAELRKERFV
jgi:hypothetical protein